MIESVFRTTLGWGNQPRSGLKVPWRYSEAGFEGSGSVRTNIVLVERGYSVKAYIELSRCVEVAQCVEMEVLWGPGDVLWRGLVCRKQQQPSNLMWNTLQ